MPELPEVETIARALREGRRDAAGALVVPPLVGRTIVQTQVLWAREISNVPAGRFEQQTAGRRVTSVGRHGKYLIIDLQNGGQRSGDEAPSSAADLSTLSMLVHLRMSGRLDLVPQAEAHSTHARVVWQLDAGWALRFDDARKFGRVYLVNDPAHITGKIGPDALQMTAGEFVSRLKQRRGALKPLLLDQRFIAGVGNIYADESLFLAGLHPKCLAQTLTEADALRLHTTICRVLLDGIAANGASFDWVYPGGNYQENFRVYGRKGQPCVTCGTPITRIVVGQRGTHVCLQCQQIN